MCAGRTSLAAALALALAACGTVHAPRGAVPLPADAQREAFGGWAIVTRNTGNGSAMAHEGELIAVSRDSVWLLRDSTLLAIAATEVRRAEVAGYNSRPGNVTAMAALGALSTISNGFYLVFTAPAWGIIGAGGSSAQAKAARIRTESADLVPLGLYARFPQGMPSGLDRAALRGRARAADGKTRTAR